MAIQQVHARVSNELYNDLKAIAAHQKVSLNKVIESVLSRFVEENKKRKLAEAFDKYVEKNAKHSEEFVQEFDPVVTRQLLEETEW